MPSWGTHQSWTTIRGAEPTERLPLAVRLAARLLLEEAGLDGAVEEGL